MKTAIILSAILISSAILNSHGMKFTEEIKETLLYLLILFASLDLYKFCKGDK